MKTFYVSFGKLASKLTERQQRTRTRKRLARDPPVPHPPPPPTSFSLLRLVIRGGCVPLRQLAQAISVHSSETSAEIIKGLFSIVSRIRIHGPSVHSVRRERR